LCARDAGQRRRRNACGEDHFSNLSIHGSLPVVQDPGIARSSPGAIFLFDAGLMTAKDAAPIGLPLDHFSTCSLWSLEFLTSDRMIGP
jgi:hypothetical protein